MEQNSKIEEIPIYIGARKVNQNGQTVNVTLPAIYRKNYLKGHKLVSIEIMPDGKLILTPAEIQKVR